MTGLGAVAAVEPAPSHKGAGRDGTAKGSSAAVAGASPGSVGRNRSASAIKVAADAEEALVATAADAVVTGGGTDGLSFGQ